MSNLVKRAGAVVSLAGLAWGVWWITRPEPDDLPFDSIEDDDEPDDTYSVRF